jgi:hypothetical protein
MNALAAQLDRLQTPREDRTALIEPPLDRMAGLLADNLRIADGREYDLQGRPLTEISQLARTELCEAARRWTAAYRDLSAALPNARGPIFLAGHQPQMFHPGVWFKNFVLGRLAEEHGAAAINLIIDGDTLSDPSLRVPGGSVSEPSAQPIPFDRPEPRIPYEERKIEDRELFASFGRRVAERIAPLVAEPLIRRYWPLVLARAEQSDNLGTCLAQARHQLESHFPAEIAGTGTLEVPQSWICRGEAFQWFTAHLLARLPQFRAVYNEALDEYRRLHRVRSPAHPAPDLAEDGPWLEAPLWVWTAADPRRRRLFARTAGGEIVLSDRGSWQARLPLAAEGDAARAAQRLTEIHRGGVRIRPRALITTLWARLALGDVFIHGIGGAKYDRVTDRLIERFFGLPAPGFMVVSATLHLPVRRPHDTPADAGAIARELRDMTYNPERYLPSFDDLTAAKRRWIETPPTRENARQRCQAIRQVNASLQPLLEDRRRQLTDRQVAVARNLRAQTVLAWREYAFCLYPEPTLQGFISELLAKRG